MTDQPVVVVTGGGGGIGAAVAEELGRTGWFVVTVDPLVSLDGSQQLAAVEATTADRIVAAGGAARASGVSVTDGEAVRGLFDELVAEHGHLDAVINVAGISRPTSFTKGTEEDWLGILRVHLDGYRNVLAAALPIMAAAGRGRILGVTSGSGWRQADTGAYGCAKRAVASLTWQLGQHAPEGVVINAMSPIAMTRMVTAALGRAPSRGGPEGSAATGGLSLGAMPPPEALGPSGAYLVGDAFTSWCRGQVVYVGGSEMAVIDGPRLLEVVRTENVGLLGHLLEAVTPGALAPAEARQESNGAGTPRFGSDLAEVGSGELPPSEVRTCAVVSDRPGVAAAISTALEGRGVTCTPIDAPADLEGGAFDVVVTAAVGPDGAGEASEWERILAEHSEIVEQIHGDASWARAVADLAVGANRAVRLVTVTDAVTAGGRSRAQSSAQLARSARRATGDLVSAFAVSAEGADDRSLGELVAHLACSPEATALSGAELAAGPGWIGLRSHPRPRGSVTFGGPEVPEWLDGALREIVG